MNESVRRIKKEGNSEELAKIVANMKNQQFNEQSVGNASHSDDASEGPAKTNGLPKEEKKKRGRKKELPLRVEDKSQSVVDMGEDSEIESVEDEERPSTKEIVVNCVSCVFFLMRGMLSVALGVSVFVDPTRIPYGLVVCACVEPLSMLVQLFSMSNNFAYKLNSITSLSVLLFCFCIAFHQVTDTVCMLFCIVLGLEIAVDMFVIFASGENESSAVVFTTVSLLAFVGGFAVLIEGLLPLFGVLLVFQILVVTIVFNTPDQVAGTASLIAIPVGFFSLLLSASMMPDSWFFFYLPLDAIIEAYIVSRCCANSDACIILFGFDLALFLWWCWMTLSSQSVPYACHFVLSVMYGITTGFFAAFDTKVNKWTVTILVITSTCLMGCSWISVAIDHVALTVVCDTLNMILFTASAYAYNEVTIIDLAMDKRGRKEGKTYFRFLLNLVDVALAAVWLWLCIRWMNATKKSPSTPSMLLLIILSSYITLSPLVVLVATVFKDTVYSILRLALFATVFGYCVKAVQFSTRFTPFPFLGGAVLLFQVVFFSVHKVVTLLVA